MDLIREKAILKKTKEIMLTNKSRVETHLAFKGRELRLILDNKIISGTPLIQSSISYITIHASRWGLCRQKPGGLIGLKNHQRNLVFQLSQKQFQLKRSSKPTGFDFRYFPTSVENKFEAGLKDNFGLTWTSPEVNG